MTVISLIEKNVPFERVDVDLADKPEWFKVISPLGKTPVLRVGDWAIFESAVSVEYLEKTQPSPLRPRRTSIVGRVRLGDAERHSGSLFRAGQCRVRNEGEALAAKFDQIERRLGAGPYFRANVESGACPEEKRLVPIPDTEFEAFMKGLPR